MRILACIPFHYYDSLAVTFSYYYTVRVLRSLGHHVHLFEFIEQAVHDKEGMNDFFLAAVKKIGYDLVFVETSKDEFFPEVLDEARRQTLTLAWNSDDDWRWETYSSRWCEHYTYMVTTYRRVYEANRQSHANLLLSQWGCTGLFDGASVPKEIPISFVGGIYGDRPNLLHALRSRAGLQIFSRAGLPPRSWPKRAVRKAASLWYGAPLRAEGHILDYQEVNDIWNRSQVSLTPLQASRNGRLQIKGRVFEMGCSGTVMLCHRNPDLYEFYEPGEEFVEFDSVEECVQRARHLLAHDAERQRIAEAYRRRTLAEHMWAHRYREMFQSIGLAS